MDSYYVLSERIGYSSYGTPKKYTPCFSYKMYHFVWIPKYRRKVFTDPYRTVLKNIIEQIGYDYNIEIVELEIPVDHIIKSISAQQFFRLHPDIKKKIWGCPR